MVKITLANTKGGVGKSTIACNFACIAATDKKSLLIDTDVQESSMKFRAMRPESIKQFQAVSIQTPTVHRDIDAFTADTIIIDAGGRDSKVFRSALMAADAIIIPLRPGQYDIWSSEETFKIIEEVRQFKKLKVAVMLNQVIAGTNISKEVQQAISELSTTYNLHQFKTNLHSRVAYEESISDGLSVTEVKDKKYKKASVEMMALYNELMTWL